MNRVLAFGCHPDDIEFSAAGTLALLAERGWEIHLATMAGGEVGSPTDTSQGIRKRRLIEAADSARVLDGAYHFAGGHDLEIEYNHHYRQRAVRVLRETNPTVVLTCPPMDYILDHEITSQLVRNASFIASVPLYDCGVPSKPMERIPYLYYWNASGQKDIFGRPLPLHFGIDVGPVMDVKERMLRCHQSQDEWLRYINKIDSYIANMIERTRQQGKLIGRAFGECFIQHLGNGHPQDNILADELGDSCVGIL
jgi:LmbE family N-acetylglucosaminyl deacetylase